MSRNFAIAVLLLGAPVAFAQTPVIQSVLNAADYSPLIAPGVWVAIFGSNLAPAPVTDTTLPLPVQLGGVSVTLGGTQLPLRYVSPDQINALLPFNFGEGFYSFVVSAPSGVSPPYEGRMSTLAPAIYTQNAAGTGPALAFDGNFNPVSQVSTSPLVLYASGLGPTNPPGTTAGGNTAEPFNRVVTAPTVLIGGTIAQVDFAGLAPGLPGIYQLNVTPAGPLLDNTLSVQFRFFPKNFITGATTTLPVAAGLNTANLTGSITPTYPLNTTGLDFSALLTAANLSVGFDILPAAKPFNLVASCPGGSLSVAFSPSTGTWQATSNVPTAAERAGNFSADSYTVLDFLNGNLPFAGNFVPQSRLDPVAVQAGSGIPLPNYSGAIANVNFFAQGTIPAGGHFAIDGSNNPSLANFEEFLTAAAPGANGENLRTRACSLTVDGALVSSSLVTFQ